MVNRLAGMVALAVVSGCREELADDLSSLAEPTILAVSAEPAEAAPGSAVTYTVLVVDQTGIVSAEPSWAYCLDRKPLTELGPVAPSCLEPGGAGLVPLGAGPAVTAQLPADGCRLFGPDSPEPTGGLPAGRPVDPDTSGGYYQPVILRNDGGPAVFVAHRIVCGVAGAKPEVAADFGRRYRPNANPVVRIAGAVGEAGKAYAFDEATKTISGPRPGERVRLEVSWPACPTTALCGDGTCLGDEDAAACPADCDPIQRGCGGAERYLLHDQERRELVERREAITVSWYAAAGELASHKTGSAEDGPSRTATSGAHPPSRANTSSSSSPGTIAAAPGGRTCGSVSSDAWLWNVAVFSRRFHWMICGRVA